MARINDEKFAVILYGPGYLSLGKGLWPIEASYHPCDLGGWWQDKSVTVVVTVSSWSPNGGALLGIFSEEEWLLLNGY